MLRRPVNLRIKIFLALFFVGVGSTLLSSWEHYTFLKTTLINKSIDHFISIRDSRKHEIERYFNRMHTATLMLSKGWTIVAAAKDFQKAFVALDHELPPQSTSNPPVSQALRDRYAKVVETAHFSTSQKVFSTVETSLPHDPRSLYLQNLYVTGQDAGQQKNLSANLQTTYEKTHARYHAFFSGYGKDLNVHDLFLIDRASGVVVYSTRKELDFATNILDGAWKDGPLAKVFKSVVAAEGGGVKVTDFEKYCPANHQPAAFVAAPVRDGSTTIAVLVLAISVDEINAAMTDNEKWREQGLGATGETYLVGPDYTMRSDSRFLLESRQQFFAQEKEQQVPAATLAEMQNDNTSILLLKVATESVQRAFKGETGSALIKDYRGVPVLSAFTPLDISGVHWVLLAEIDQDEIFSSVAQLRDRVFFLLVITLVLVNATGAFLAASLAKPISTLIAGVRQLGHGSMADRIDVTSRDEVGELAVAFNQMAANLSLKTVSLDYFSSIINSMNEMLFVLGIDVEKQTTVISEVNQAALEKLGYPKGDFAGNGVENFFLEKDGEKLFSGEKLAELLAIGWSQGREIIFMSRTGEAIPVILSASVMGHPEDVSPAGIVLIAQDITERQKSEQELRRVNRAMQTLIDCNQAVSCAETDDALLQSICNAVVGKSGYQLAWIGFAEDDQLKSVRTAAQSGYDDGYLEHLRVSWADDEWGGGPTGMAIKSGEPQVIRNILTDSRFQPWREQACLRGYQSSLALPLLDPFLGTIGALNIYAPEPDAFDAQEIDLLREVAVAVVNGLNTLRGRREHAQAVAELAQSEERFRGIFEQAAVGIALVATNGNWIMVNQKLCNMVGYTREELLALSFQRITHPEDLEDNLNYKDRMLAGEMQNYALEKRYICKDGHSLWVNLSISLVRDEHGQPKFFISVVEDIGARKQAEAEQEKLVAIIEHSPDFIGIAALDGQLLYLNNSGRTLVGMVKSGPLNEVSILDYLSPDQRDHFAQEIFPTALATGAWHGELSLLPPGSGKLLVVELNLFVVADNMDQGAIGMAVIARDLTERNESESRLRQAQKMEAMGTLAGGIAHDFNNILSAILGYSQIAEVESRGQVSLHEDIKEIVQASLRAADLVKQILTFSRKVDHALIPLRPHLIIKESLKLLRASLPSTIAMEVDAEDCGAILADPTQLHQIMMNLCTNAFHAMENEKGVLRVSLARRMLAAQDIDGEFPVSAGSFVELAVSDSGCGMDAETLIRIFEPYFTTKEVGSGTGLGLALVHSIVESCGGVIKVKSAPGVGTLFKVFLPSYIKVGIKEKAEGTANIQTGNERILVVDDESSIVALYQSSLGKLGYRVTGTTSSLEALMLFEDNPEAFDVVITDQTMPQMTGFELVENIRNLRPEMPIIICTGYSSILSKKEAAELGVDVILMKPVEREKLAQEIRNVLVKR